MGISNDSQLKLVCEEIATLEWINRALMKQISKNENRLAELDKKLWELKEAKGEQSI